jgi:hypothetical protein
MTTGALRQAVQRGAIVPTQRTVGGQARYSPEAIKAILARVRPGKSPGSKFTVDYEGPNRKVPSLSASQFIQNLLTKRRISRLVSSKKPTS